VVFGIKIVFPFTLKHTAGRVSAHKTTYPRREFDHFNASSAEFRNPLNRHKPRQGALEVQSRRQAVVQFHRFKLQIIRDQYRTGLATRSINDPLALATC